MNLRFQISFLNRLYCLPTVCNLCNDPELNEVKISRCKIDVVTSNKLFSLEGVQATKQVKFSHNEMKRQLTIFSCSVKKISLRLFRFCRLWLQTARWGNFKMEKCVIKTKSYWIWFDYKMIFWQKFSSVLFRSASKNVDTLRPQDTYPYVKLLTWMMKEWLEIKWKKIWTTGDRTGLR